MIFIDECLFFIPPSQIITRGVFAIELDSFYARTLANLNESVTHFLNNAVSFNTHERGGIKLGGTKDLGSWSISALALYNRTFSLVHDNTKQPLEEEKGGGGGGGGGGREREREREENKQMKRKREKEKERKRKREREREKQGDK